MCAFLPVGSTLASTSLAPSPADDFIVNKYRGKSGPMFNFDVHDDVRLVADATIEKDEVCLLLPLRATQPLTLAVRPPVARRQGRRAQLVQPV